MVKIGQINCFKTLETNQSLETNSGDIIQEKKAESQYKNRNLKCYTSSMPIPLSPLHNSLEKTVLKKLSGLQ